VLDSKSVTSARGLGQQDVGHAGVATGGGELSLRSPVQREFGHLLNSKLNAFHLTAIEG